MAKTKGATEGIRLVSVEAENVRKLTTVAVRLDGEPGLFRVTGDNEEGKTTLLDIIAMLFGGAKAVKPDTIQMGKDGAWCRAELSNGYSIEKRFTAAAPDGYLTVTTPDDAKPNAPQTLLDGWCGPHSFDPGALLKKRTSEIEAIILGLAKDPDLKAKRSKIASNREALKDERRPLNSQKQKAERTKRPTGSQPEPVDVSAELERLEGLRGQAAERATLAWELSEGEKLIEANMREQEKTVAAIDDLRLKAARLETEEEELKDTGEKVRAQREAIPDPAKAIEAVSTHLADANDILAALEPWREWERSQTEAKEAGEKAVKLTKAIKALDAEEEALLKAAEIPVRGISFDLESGGMLLDDHPLEVASGMRRLDMTCDMAFAADSQVKVILLDEANDYGIKALDQLRERATGKGWQVIACRLGLEGAGEIIIEDGRAEMGPVVD